MFNELDETRYRERYDRNIYASSRVNIFYKILEKYLSILDSFGILHLGITNNDITQLLYIIKEI